MIIIYNSIIAITVGGYALGPHWLQQLKLKDLIDEIQNNEKRKGKLKVLFKVFKGLYYLM